ncbi:MAG: alpha-L-arabinofuranosidase, partial [Chitinophagaceae bacterium]
ENRAQTINLDLDGKKKVKSAGFIDELESGNLNQLNSIENPQAINPKRTSISIKGKKINLVLKPYSFNVIRIPFNS